jgi:hypothetical protein
MATKIIEYKKDGLVFQFQKDTINTKTGQMIQNYIIPMEWVEVGRLLEDDTKICFSCPLSQTNGNGSCYVRKGMSNLGLISKVKSLHKRLNSIPDYSEEIENKILDLCKNEAIRFGAYGEPILLGENLVQKITKVSKQWTGYTHRWYVNNWSKDYFNASVETEILANKAISMGFRTFFVGQPTNMEKYVNCPASKEAGKLTTCDKCGLCKGTASKGKNIYINKH